MTEATKRLIAAACPAIWPSAAGSGSESRPCKPEQELEAKSQLKAIAKNAERMQGLIEVHLPFGQRECEFLRN